MNDEEIANLCITLIHQATYMLHKLLATMQTRFVTEGGIKERMYEARLNYRNTKNNLNTPNTLNNPKTPKEQPQNTAEYQPNK